MKITIDDIQKEPTKSIYELIVDAKNEATLRGIKANSILINRGLVFVPGDPFLYPEMICGLKSYVTSKDLPEDYAFAVLHDPNREQETQMKWIPVTESLPEIHEGWAESPEPVLYMTKNTKTIYAGYYGEGGVWRDKYFRQYADSRNGVDADDVLCWMYQHDLPQPPKGE